jgi:hypothetical protein
MDTPGHACQVRYHSTYLDIPCCMPIAMVFQGSPWSGKNPTFTSRQLTMVVHGVGIYSHELGRLRMGPLGKSVGYIMG